MNPDSVITIPIRLGWITTDGLWELLGQSTAIANSFETTSIVAELRRRGEPAGSSERHLFEGVVTDAGGMQVQIRVHVDTMQYPEVGTYVRVYRS